MSLRFYDSGQVLFNTDPLHTYFDGYQGGTHDLLIYIKNSDVATYYTNVQLRLYTDTYQDLGVLGATGWGVKFSYGQRRPTEAEWDLILPGEPINLPDIGTIDTADITTFHPVWVRAICPGGQPAQIRRAQKLRVYHFERAVV